jgi:hypothetical protein
MSELRHSKGGRIDAGVSDEADWESIRVARNQLVTVGMRDFAPR